MGGMATPRWTSPTSTTVPPAWPSWRSSRSLPGIGLLTFRHVTESLLFLTSACHGARWSVRASWTTPANWGTEPHQLRGLQRGGDGNGVIQRQYTGSTMAVQRQHRQLVQWKYQRGERQHEQLVHW